MFTSIPAAIEEARFLKKTTRRCHGVIQRNGGYMLVRMIDRKDQRTLYTTKQDAFGVVNTDEVEA